MITFAGLAGLAAFAWFSGSEQASYNFWVTEGAIFEVLKYE